MSIEKITDAIIDEAKTESEQILTAAGQRSRGVIARLEKRIEDEINEAYEWLVELDQKMEPAYATDEAIDGLIFGEKAMGVMYSGDAAYILSENENSCAMIVSTFFSICKSPEQSPFVPSFDFK